MNQTNSLLVKKTLNLIQLRNIFFLILEYLVFDVNLYFYSAYNASYSAIFISKGDYLKEKMIINSRLKES